MEEWKQVIGYENYYVSSDGRVYNTATENFIGIKQSGKYKYKRIKLSSGWRYKFIDIHRLVAETFIPNPNNLPVVNHINGITTDNRIENLEWCTYLQNYKHAIENGLSHEINSNKLTENDVREIRKIYIPNSRKYSCEKLAKKYNVSRSTIERCVNKKTWRKTIWFSFGKFNRLG